MMNTRGGAQKRMISSNTMWTGLCFQTFVCKASLVLTELAEVLAIREALSWM